MVSIWKVTNQWARNCKIRPAWNWGQTNSDHFCFGQNINVTMKPICKIQNVKYAEQVATDNGEGELSGNWEGGPRRHSRTGNSRRSLRKKQRKTKLSWRIVISSTLWFSSKFVRYVWAEYILKDITSEPFLSWRISLTLWSPLMSKCWYVVWCL